MIGTRDIRHDKSLINIIQKIFGNEKIVDPPAHIPLSGSGFHVPPCILSGFFVKIAERIDIAVS